MNKKELGLVLADRMNLTQVEAKRLTNALFDILMEEISSGVSVKMVPSRFMRKFICRLRLSEVSRQ